MRELGDGDEKYKKMMIYIIFITDYLEFHTNNGTKLRLTGTTQQDEGRPLIYQVYGVLNNRFMYLFSLGGSECLLKLK